MDHASPVKALMPSLQQTKLLFAYVGLEGQQLMRALKQPNLPVADLAALPHLAALPVLPERRVAIGQRIKCLPVTV